MDPKQTEGQKSVPAAPQGGFSFQTGQMNLTPNPVPGQVPPSNASAPSANTLSTGANISRTINALTTDRKSATVNSPFAKHHFDKVAPQTGDILIAPSTPRPKSRFFARKKKNDSSISMIENTSSPTAPGGKLNRGRLIQFGLIFGGIALVGLVVFTIVMVINQPKKSSNTSGDSSNAVVVGDPKELFDEYLQKLITGEVGKAEYTSSSGKTYSIFEILQAVIGTGTMGSNILYADQIVNSETSDNRDTYINELNDIFNSFSASYSGEYLDDLSQISYYYYDFAKIQPVSEEMVINLYQDNGYDQAIADISNMYEYNDNRGLNDYNTYSREYALTILNLVNDANTRLDCAITSIETAKACVGLSSLESYAAYIDAGNTYYINGAQVKNDIRGNALELIGDIYSEYYNSPEDNNNEVQE